MIAILHLEQPLRLGRRRCPGSVDGMKSSVPSSSGGMNSDPSRW